MSLENLSLAHCPISDEGLESMYIFTIIKTKPYQYCQMFGVCSLFVCLFISVICQSVKYSTNIRNIDFTGCNITWRGAEHMASIINVGGFIHFYTSFFLHQTVADFRRALLQSYKKLNRAHYDVIT